MIAVWDRSVKDNVVLSQEVIENPFSGLDKGKGIKLAEMIAGMEVDVLYIKESFEGKGP